MTDTMLLDDIALEAAAKGVMDNDGCTRDGICAKCKEAAQAAITAYFASLKERGKMEGGYGHIIDYGDGFYEMLATSSEPADKTGRFPVVIIRITQPKES